MSNTKTRFPDEVAARAKAARLAGVPAKTVAEHTGISPTMIHLYSMGRYRVHIAPDPVVREKITQARLTFNEAVAKAIRGE